MIRVSTIGLLTLWMMAAPLTLEAEVRGEDPTEAKVRQIAKELRCAVCQNQSVYESNSDLAKDMLKLIRDKVSAGESEPQIRDYFFQRYGDYIYLEPTTGGMNKVLWGAPFIGLAIGAVALWSAMRRWRAKAMEESRSDSTRVETDPNLQARIRQELDQVNL
ncbi:MAG: cytochrome c-type biogenesis protein CcmH [Magnetococcales bacterium]|nr:cytochrome c-type biogenesis protein CcmH [Magnetococcales bacterium]NGZ05374.1 cytochrome c-type biogenesis protein CcmH [Magnetococcales bacterium]